MGVIGDLGGGACVSRYLPGDIPTARLKALLKADSLEYPTRVAIVLMPVWVLRSSSRALRIRQSVRYCNGGRPTAAENRAAKELRPMLVASAKEATVH